MGLILFLRHAFERANFLRTNSPSMPSSIATVLALLMDRHMGKRCTCFQRVQLCLYAARWRRHKMLKLKIRLKFFSPLKGNRIQRFIWKMAYKRISWHNLSRNSRGSLFWHILYINVSENNAKTSYVFLKYRSRKNTKLPESEGTYISSAHTKDTSARLYYP